MRQMQADGRICKLHWTVVSLGSEKRFCISLSVLNAYKSYGNICN